ncbi:hypothetical protein EF908_33850, partial [Streptomyces sp. WAC04770]
DLPGDQNKLIAAVAAANPSTVVVINAGAAMTMPWAKDVPGIVGMWLPGQEGAAALAGVLTGKVNPSGKLPVTFPLRSADDPVRLTDMKTQYAEGLLVGYRGYEARGVAPLFAFGRPRLPARRVLAIRAVRSAVIAVMAIAFFWGIVRVPLAEAIALTFIAPLIALGLAAIFLKEKIGARSILGS